MNDPKTLWKTLRNQTRQAIGDQFWNDMARLLPFQGPRADMYGTNEELVVVIELPGLASIDKVSVSTNGKALQIKGELFCDYRLQEENLLLSERFTGGFHRRIELPQEIDPEKVDARYENGLLTVRLKKKPEAEEKPIQVKTDQAKGSD